MEKVNVFMTNLLGPSWRTTVLGYLGAVLNLVAGGMSLKNAAVSAAIAIFGHVAGDAKADKK